MVGVLLEKRALSFDRYQLQALQSLVQLIHLLNIPLRCNGFTGIQEAKGHHQMANTKIRLIKFFATKEGEALYSQQKQNQGLTVAQIMNSLLPNSD